MSELLHIRTVSSQSKIEVLREFGHRTFVEIDNGGKPTGFFVEIKEGTNLPTSKSPARRRTPITGNVALVWTNRPFKCKRPDSAYARMAGMSRDLAAKPARRADLVMTIAKASGYTQLQVTNAISRLTVEGFLVVPG